MTTKPNGSVNFDFAPPAQRWMFANVRLTPELLACAKRVREHAIESEVRLRSGAETPT